jgi:hypothetical protein
MNYEYEMRGPTHKTDMLYLKKARGNALTFGNTMDL